MTVTVGEVIRAAAAALQLNQHEYLEELIRFVIPDVGGDSDPGRDTILSYAQADRTRCGHKFAGMVLDQLHANRHRIKTPNDLARAEAACRLTLIENRKIRYSAPPKTNAASQRRISQISGIYLLLRRRASSDHAVRQELLVLSHEGRADKQTFATYVTPEIVCRGHWCVIQQNVCCMMHGFRGDYRRRDVVNMQLLYEDPDISNPVVILSGFITGITSGGLRPVVLPAFAVRVPDVMIARGMMDIGDCCDSELRASWEAVADQRSSQIEKMGRILDNSMSPRNGAIIINDGVLSGPALKIYDRLETVFHQEFLQYLSRGRSNWRNR